MNRLVINIGSFIILLFLTTGCSGRIVENKVDNEKIIPSGITNETGSGEFNISTSVMNSEKGIPVIVVDEFKGLAQLGFNSEGFDNSRDSYIYIDGVLNSVEKLGELNNITLTIDEDSLINGNHKVEVVQFDNNKTSGTPITYKICNYEVRIK